MSTKQLSGVARVVVLGLAACSVTGGVSARSQPPAAIAVDDRRPLASLVDALEKRYGLPITYEDPLYVHGSQIADVTEAVRRTRNNRNLKILVPRGGRFVFDAAVGIDHVEADMPAMLRRLLAAYGSTGYAGRFTLVQSDGAWHVVPASYRNARGADESYSALLSREISTVRHDERRAYEAIEDIAAALTHATGVQVNIGMIPVNLLAERRVTGGASNEPARSVLMRILASTGQPCSWRLFYDPSPPGSYVLNIHVVRRPQSP